MSATAACCASATLRMIDKSYGKVVWRSLPPMRRTRAEADAVAFLESLPPPRQG